MFEDVWLESTQQLWGKPKKCERMVERGSYYCWNDMDRNLKRCYMLMVRDDDDDDDCLI